MHCQAWQAVKLMSVCHTCIVSCMHSHWPCNWCSNGGFLTFFAGAGVPLEEYDTTTLSCPPSSLVIGFETVGYYYGFQSLTVGHNIRSFRKLSLPVYMYRHQSHLACGYVLIMGMKSIIVWHLMRQCFLDHTVCTAVAGTLVLAPQCYELTKLFQEYVAAYHIVALCRCSAVLRLMLAHRQHW